MMARNFINTISEQIPIQEFWSSILDEVHGDVLSSGKPINIIKSMRLIRNSFFLSLVLLIPSSLILSAYVSPLFLSLNLVWMILLILPKLYLGQLGDQRKKLVNEELPLATMFLSVMQSVGVNLYHGFQIMQKTKIFSAMNGESRMLKRNVEIFGLSEVEALSELAQSHKSHEFRNLLFGYTSIWKSGGDLALYLESRSDEFFVNFRQKFQSYSNNVGTVVEALVTLMIVLPILIMVISFVMPGSSMQQMGIFATIGLPMFAIILGVFITSIQPKISNRIGLNTYLLVGLIAGGFTLGAALYFIFEQPLWIAFSAGFLAPTAIVTGIISFQMRELRQIEGALPQFLRDITEYKKIGYDVTLAIITLSRENTYNKSFDAMLQELRIMLEHGTTPSEAVASMNFRSYFAKISFFIVAYVAEYGGGTAKTLETITRLITNIKQLLAEGKSSVSFYGMLIFAAPIIMVLTAIVIQGMTSLIDSSSFDIGTGINDLPGMTQNQFATSFVNLVTISPEFIDLVKTMIITSSIMGALVITKAIDFTFFNAWRILVVGAIAIISVIIMDEATLGNLDLSIILGDLS